MTRKFTLALFALIFLAAATAEAGIFKRKARRHHATATACAGGRCATPTTARPTAYPPTWEARVTVMVAPPPVLAPPACSTGACHAR